MVHHISKVCFNTVLYIVIRYSTINGVPYYYSCYESMCYIRNGLTQNTLMDYSITLV